MPKKTKAEQLALIEEEYRNALDSGKLNKLPEIEKKYRKTLAKWNHWKDKWTSGHRHPFGSMEPIDGEKWIFLTDDMYASPYAVSDLGRIYDFVHGKIIKPFKGKQDGEWKISFNANAEVVGRNQLVRNVKRIVADAFIPNPHRVRGIGFKDGNTFNFRADNLVRYETPYDKRWGIKAE